MLTSGSGQFALDRLFFAPGAMLPFAPIGLPAPIRAEYLIHRCAGHGFSAMSAFMSLSVQTTISLCNAANPPLGYAFASFTLPFFAVGEGLFSLRFHKIDTSPQLAK